MAEVVRFKISPAVAAFVRPGVTAEKKLVGIQTAPHQEPFDRVTLLFCLLKDAEPSVKAAAVAAFSALPAEICLSYIHTPDAHPAVLNEFARIYHGDAAIADGLLEAGSLTSQAREFLQRQKAAAPAVIESPSVQEPSEDLPDEAPEDIPDDAPDDDTVPDDDELPDSDDETQEVEAAEFDEDAEEFLSKYKIAMLMGIGEKIKMALSGDKEWRAILIKDTNKLVSGSVIKNPRITDAEILTILKVGVQNDEIIRLICANKEWVKNYLIRKALVTCPKTPLPNALRYLATLNEKDIAAFAKSKNISSVVSTQAKRILLSKKR
jgi:hypothetical protein